ncbi:PhzF family phenazine biosynthesis protein [Sphingomonas corticis]|uniref:PhzF family phenazine biosynthesis protein n=1 Tax=Sphingomonas corticis TaxID=2722791 RepID=A0ABX1CSJ2_9SPHN|nr:PhzF family phenazine biosynthesis protein [Sphingomonas corticis]NJR80281.1 PhzF family phenazine biosynthesis protein [Sphingomonas corticis]
MRKFDYRTVDVFTDRRFGGNPLAVFTDARGMSDEEMLRLSAEMNLSETTFVLPPDDPANTARVRIFNRTAEMPFAGHPNVGTAFVLASTGRASGEVLRFEEMAGIVEVDLVRDAGMVGGASIKAPRPLELLGEVEPAAVAGCIGADPAKIVLDRHPPVVASVGVDFVIAEFAPEALGRATPDLAAFRAARAASGLSTDRLSLFCYARDGGGVRARMFAPLAGTWEDPATGSANATLAALLLSLGGDERIAFRSTQGVEMGRRSVLDVHAWRADDGIRAGVGGSCVPMFTGSVELD